MAHWNFHRNVMSVRLLSELAIELGTTADFLLSGSGLSKDQLAESELLISAQQELQVIRNLVSTSSQKPALGIIAGTRYHFTVFGALGFAIVSSRTMRSALDVALQHFHLTFAFTRFVVSECDSGINVQLIDNDIPAELAQFIIERDVAALITVARDLYDLQPMVTRVTFKCAPPADISNYCSFFNVEPEFSASENCVEFDRTMFDRPLPRANELAHAAAVDQCRLLLESRSTRDGVAALVRDKMVSMAGYMPRMDEVSASLCMTSRTLRRRLAGERVTFAELRDEVRMSIAEELLNGPRLSIPQIAERLGYAEPTSFINAFRRWHGITPHAYRLESKK